MGLFSKIKRILGCNDHRPWVRKFQEDILKELLKKVGVKNPRTFIFKHKDSLLLPDHVVLEASCPVRYLLACKLFDLLVSLDYTPTGNDDNYSHVYAMFSKINYDNDSVIPDKHLSCLALKFAMGIIAMPPVEFIKNCIADHRKIILKESNCDE